MARCRNCGQTTARTEDWACQWCGYPLLSEFCKKIPKTYKQLREEKPYKQEPPVKEETEPSLMRNHGTLPPTRTLEFEPELIQKPEPAPESMIEPEPKPIIKREPESVLAAESEPMIKPESVLEPPPELEPAAMEVTVEELVSAYEADEKTADARFVNQILKVTGAVDRIEVKDILDIHYITLISAEKPLLQSVRCMFDKGHGDSLYQLIRGQRVTVQGRFDGSIIELRLRDCILVL